jgi:peptidyl-prolyl cis-trans isomerase A (cyclophilin A)
MARHGFATVFFLGLLAFGCAGVRERAESRDPRVRIRTELGDLVVEVYAERAPITAANFLRYVDENRFESASFYRVVTMENQPNDSIRIEVVQGGIGFVESDLRLPPIPHETTDRTGVRHRDGTISMARLEPGTASSEFFVCFGEQPELDFGGRRNPDGQGFAAFGRVREGMDTVRKIHGRGGRDQMLDSPVRILEVARVP